MLDLVLDRRTHVRGTLVLDALPSFHALSPKVFPRSPAACKSIHQPRVHPKAADEKPVIRCGLESAAGEDFALAFSMSDGVARQSICPGVCPARLM
jgi:hypothetical protein